MRAFVVECVVCIRSLTPTKFLSLLQMLQTVAQVEGKASCWLVLLAFLACLNNVGCVVAHNNFNFSVEL